MYREETGEKRIRDNADTSASLTPAKRARTIANSREHCVAHGSGAAVDSAPSQQTLLIDALPSEIVCAVMANVYPTSALVRAGSVCRRFYDAATFVRAQRVASRRRAGPHADLIGCAHQLLNAISLDDPDGVVDALDTGNVSFDDLLDPAYLWSAATPNIVARVVGAPSLAPSKRPGRPILERVDNDPARTGYYTPLQAAVLCGSAMCVRALVAMGARASPCQVGPLVRVVVGTLAWNDIHVSHISSAVARMDDASRAEARPRIAVGRNGEPDSAHVDPIQLLSPIMTSLPAGYLGGASGRGILMCMMAKAIGRIAHMPVDRRVDQRPQSACPRRTDVHGAFSPPVIDGLDAAIVAGLVRAVEEVVNDACDLAAFLIDHGCRPWCAVRPPFGKRTTEGQDGTACGDLQEQRREVDHHTERLVAIRLLDKTRAVSADRRKKDTPKESSTSLFGEQAACFLIESLVALYDHLHPSL